MTKGKLVLIIGPSGVGKSVVLKALKERHPELHFPRSATTRARREGEGDDLYRFVSDEEFDGLVENKKVLEWAIVHGEERYGTLEEEIIPFIKEGKIVVREVDVQGFESIRKHGLFFGKKAPYKLESVFILPENRDVLINRIRNRAPISDAELRRRVKSMDDEMKFAELCDHRVTNSEGKLENTVKEVEKLIGLV